MTGLDDPGVYKDDQAVQIARNYVSSYTRLAAQYLAQGDPERTALCLDRAEQVFSAMPAEWLPIMPSFVMLKSRLFMGTQGTGAARQFVMESTAYMESLAVSTGTRGLDSAITQLAAVAREFEQAEAFSAVIDSISDGSPGQEWIRIEAALAFGDYITARDILRTLGEEIEDPVLLDLMETTVDRHTIPQPLQLRAQHNGHRPGGGDRQHGPEQPGPPVEDRHRNHRHDHRNDRPGVTGRGNGGGIPGKHHG